MTNKATLILIIMVGMIAALACKQAGEISNGVSKSLDERSDTFTSAGKDWSSQKLVGTDVTIELPGVPKDMNPPMPPNAGSVFTDINLFVLEDKDFTTVVTELQPTGKQKLPIKMLADTSMSSLKRQIRDLTYTVDVLSDTKAKYNGTFTRDGKSFELRGCCIYKKAKPERVWAILTLYPKDNAEAQQAGQRAIDSAAFSDSIEECN